MCGQGGPTSDWGLTMNTDSTGGVESRESQSAISAKDRLHASVKPCRILKLGISSPVLRDIKSLTEDHTASKQESWGPIKVSLALGQSDWTPHPGLLLGLRGSG